MTVYLLNFTLKTNTVKTSVDQKVNYAKTLSNLTENPRNKQRTDINKYFEYFLNQEH